MQITNFKGERLIFKGNYFSKRLSSKQNWLYKDKEKPSLCWTHKRQKKIITVGPRKNMWILQHFAFHKKLQEELTSSCGAVSIWLSWDSSTLVISAGSYKASPSSVPVAVVSRCSSILSSVMKESSFTWSIPSMSTSKSAASSPRSCSSWSEDCGATTNLVICTCKKMVRFDSCALWETGTQYDVSITCFRFGKIPSPLPRHELCFG